MPSKIPRNEIGIVIRLFFYCLMTGASYTLSKTAADSLFLSRVGSGSLPATLLFAGIATAIIASVWLSLFRRFKIENFLGATCFVTSVLFLVTWWMLPYFHHSFDFLSIVYILAEIKGCLYAINVVSSMNEMMGSNSSRTSWAVVLLGFPISSILIGVLVGVESVAWGAGAWLLVASIIDLIAGLSTIGISKHALPSTSGKKDITEQIAQATLPLANYAIKASFANWFSILIAAKVVVLTIIAFKWRVSVSDFFTANENAMATFFGYFYAVSGVATLFIQFAVTGRLLSKKRVVVPILVLPITLLFLNLLFIVGVGVTFLFVVSTISKSMDIWRRSTDSTAVHLLYTNIERKRRRGLIGRNHALIKPLAEIAASVILLPAILALENSVLIVATLVWLYATLKVIGVVKIIRKRKKKRKKKKKKLKKKMKKDKEATETNSVTSQASASNSAPR
jgi:hypothetical protein